MLHTLSRLLNWDFIKMGKGIQSRHARCAGYWEPHLRCTREFIDAHAHGGGRIAILGAGRLLDVDLGALLSRFSEIHLFDADPTVLKTWRHASGLAFRDRVVPRITDVTGSLKEWSAGLTQAVRQKRLAVYLDSLQPRKGGWEHEAFDGIISLNLSGQIPIYWRDRVVSVARTLSDEDEKALINSMARLQSAHICAVRERARAWSIMITDTEYYAYTVDRAEWDVEPALYGTTLQDINSPASGIEKIADSRWLWHLVPQFIESDEEGIIHRVEAFAWSSNNPKP
jgi:hypothetical protein